MTDLPQSKAAANAARVRLEQSVDTLRVRLRPAALMRDGKELAKRKAVKIVAATIASRKARPVVALGAIAAGATYLLRKPIAHALQKRLSKETDHD